MTTNPAFWFVLGFIACEITDVVALLVYRRMKGRTTSWEETLPKVEDGVDLRDECDKVKP